ncbi:MAG: Bax inhibitor-1 family protein, partial [Pseudomonadota bacterium]|nr:Bax inhibitor-1 family protein [Pseudomonadota bacterium]
MAETDTLTYRGSEAVATQKVLRNTYMLLSITLLWTAAMAGVSMALEVPPMGFIPLLVAFGVLFAINKFRNSGVGILLVFVFTGILGFSLGPIISLYVAAGASQIVVTAASLTGLIFLSLSGYTLMSQKDFSFMSGFLSVGLWVMLGCILLLWLGPLFGFYSSALHLAISAGIVIL